MEFFDRFIAARPEAARWVVSYDARSVRKNGHDVFERAWVRIPQGVRATPRLGGGLILSDAKGRTLASAIRKEKAIEPSPWVP
jgi:hypothetical protein